MENVEDVLKWVPVIVMIATTINAFTRHYSEHKSVTKAILYVCEHLSFLTSNGVETNAGRFKLPLTDKEPAKEE